MRIFAVSDLHADVRENRALLERIPATAYRDDALIVAGDVADRLSVLESALARLRERFAEVFFVPGNHELWVRGEEGSSVDKFHAVLALCARLGVRTAPARFAGAWIVPLFSWYDAAFDVRGEGVEAELEAWSDRYFCRWPEGAGPLDRLFLAMNEPRVHPYDAPVVTFSHFVPRPDLVPRVEALRFKGLAKVAGSEGIEAQIRRIGAAVHVFGHTHITEDRTIDGVRYVQHWLQRPAEGAPFLPFKEVWAAGPAPVFC
jgi:predicted phosphodiesterase